MSLYNCSIITTQELQTLHVHHHIFVDSKQMSSCRLKSDPSWELQGGNEALCQGPTSLSGPIQPFQGISVSGLAFQPSAVHHEELLQLEYHTRSKSYRARSLPYTHASDV